MSLHCSGKPLTLYEESSRGHIVRYIRACSDNEITFGAFGSVWVAIHGSRIGLLRRRTSHSGGTNRQGTCGSPGGVARIRHGRLVAWVFQSVGFVPVSSLEVRARPAGIGIRLVQGARPLGTGSGCPRAMGTFGIFSPEYARHLVRGSGGNRSPGNAADLGRSRGPRRASDTAG